MGAFVIRAVGSQDAAEIGAAHVRIWQATYRGLVDAAKLEALDPAVAQARWRDQIIPAIADQERDGIVTRCAVDDAGRIAGFATGGRARDDDAPSPDELWSLNVLPDFQGTGVAARLLDAVLGDRGAYLWVARGNLRAISFYRKHGFELDGASKFDSAWVCHDDRMLRAGQ